MMTTEEMLKKEAMRLKNGKTSCKTKATQVVKCTPHGEGITRRQRALSYVNVKKWIKTQEGHS